MRCTIDGTALTGSGQSLGLLEYYGTDLADLTTYYKNVGQTNNVPITLLSTDGTSKTCLESQGCDDLEQTIDMTQGLGMAPGLSSLVAYIGSSDAAIFNAMATASPLNAQLSSSWTWTPRILALTIRASRNLQPRVRICFKPLVTAARGTLNPELIRSP
jgi:hypothetical protein